MKLCIDPHSACRTFRGRMGARRVRRGSDNKMLVIGVDSTFACKIDLTTSSRPTGW